MFLLPQTSPIVTKFLTAIRQLSTDSTLKERVVAAGVALGTIKHVGVTPAPDIESATAQYASSVRGYVREDLSNINELVIVNLDLCEALAKNFYMAVACATVGKLDGLTVQVGDLNDSLFGLHRFIDSEQEAFINANFKDIGHVAFAVQTLLECEEVERKRESVEVVDVVMVNNDIQTAVQY